MAVKEKKPSLRRFSAAHSVVVPIASFDPEPFALIVPIPVVIQECEGGYLASFFDANLNGFGETQQASYVNLKDMIVTVFERLTEEPRKNLGREPARQLKVLQAFIRRK